MFEDVPFSCDFFGFVSGIFFLFFCDLFFVTWFGKLRLLQIQAGGDSGFSYDVLFLFFPGKLQAPFRVSWKFWSIIVVGTC